MKNEENFAQYISMLEKRTQEANSEYSYEYSEYSSWYEDKYGNDVRKEDYL